MEVCAKWFSSAINENENSLISSYKVENMNGIFQNGHIQHERTSVEASRKISKQVSPLNSSDVLRCLWIYGDMVIMDYGLYK